MTRLILPSLLLGWALLTAGLAMTLGAVVWLYSAGALLLCTAAVLTLTAAVERRGRETHHAE